MKAIIDAALEHSRTVLACLVLLLIAGAYAYNAIPKEAEPDVNIPIIYVSLHHDGISPEDAERLLVKPMEQELQSIEGIKELRSFAYESGANVVMEFEAGFDPDLAMDDVRAKVDLAKPELPDETDEPTVHEVNLSLFPVLVVSLSGNVPERTLLRLARNLQDDIETIPTVLEAEIAGDRDEQVELIVDPQRLEQYGLDAAYVLDLVNRSNKLVAAGSMDTGAGRFAVKVPGLFETIDDILDMPVKSDGDSVVTFRDVGSIRPTFEDRQGFARINGQPAIALEVSKRVGSNIIETIENVRALVEAERTNWPDEVQVFYSQDKSSNIRTMLSDLQNNVLAAILLVMVVVVAALGLRSGGLVGIAIPGSFLTGLLVIYLAGLTVNIVVLFSLILAVGMLVDGAIVVTEYADRKKSEGLDKRQAYGLAAKRMAWPIIASTATTLAAFLPLLFWPGVVGEFMKFMPLTLIAVLSASLAMALIFVPTLGSVIGGKSGSADPEQMKTIAAGESGNLEDLRGFTGVYLRFLKGALRHPGKIALLAVVLLVGVQVAYSQFGRGIEFFPSVEPENAAVWVHGRGNLSIDERDRLVREVEAQILDIQRETGAFHTVYARTVASSGRQNDDEPEDLIGIINLEFVDWFKRPSAREILNSVRARGRELPGIYVETREEEAGPPVGKAIQLQISADDPADLDPAAQRLAELLRNTGGLVGIEDGRPIPGIEWELTVDRAEAAKFGADVTLIGNYVRMVTNGMKLAEYRPDTSDEEVDIVLRLPERYRTIDQLERIRVQTDRGLVPIANFVEKTAEPKVSLLNRVDGRRVMTVKADVGADPTTGEPVLADDKVQEIRAWLSENRSQLPQGIDIAFKGEDEEQQESQAFLTKAFTVALFMMAIILVTQFNSFYSAFLILSAVVMSTIGVFIGLMVIDQPFSIVMSGIGVIALAGIVVNNNIVLIDTYDRLMGEAGDPMQAILRTGAQRLRPVLLTTITTILGLMPMVMGLNIDFINRVLQLGAPSTQWWSQLATAIVFGLGFATLLTLVFTPCMLMLRTNFQHWRQRRKAAHETSETPGTLGIGAMTKPAE
ncbi:efflux RND transporter permease subunit [Algihabitans albus]|uniref:efflux RND transporter permease subunit n=1 Tax=Algihabitans albus TaxID=2164067 RepID=UPI000E5D96F6|nr:efflux RND transporter permease subunit [Algihabitans albus]